MSSIKIKSIDHVETRYVYDVVLDVKTDKEEFEGSVLLNVDTNGFGSHLDRDADLEAEDDEMNMFLESLTDTEYDALKQGIVKQIAQQEQVEDATPDATS